MGPEEALGKRNKNLPACSQVGTNRKRIRPSRPGESEISGAKQLMNTPGDRGLPDVWKFELGASCLFLIKLTFGQL